MIKKSLIKTNVKTCHTKKRNHNNKTLKTYDSIELIDFWRYWNMFSIDKNRLNITKKRIFDNYVKYNWFYERIEID